jgi:hypothetical protein
VPRRAPPCDVVPRSAHPEDRRSIRCGMVRDSGLKGSQSSRRARVTPTLLPCHALASPQRGSVAPQHGLRRPPPLAAGAPRAGRLPGPSHHPNRAPNCRGPSPRPSPAASTDELAGIEQSAPAGRAQGPHCETKDLSEGLPAKG